MTTEQLSDEEFARRLQAQLLAEELGHDVPADNVDYMQQLSAVIRQAQEDEALAKKLQEELDNEAATQYHQTSPSQSLFHNPFPAVPTTTTPYGSTSPILVPSATTNTTATETMQIDEPEKNSNSEENEEEFQCLICYEVPDEYVILPMCKVPHVYCMECAEKMMTNQPQQNTYSPYYRRGVNNNANKTIQCPLCSAVTSLSSDRGLSALKRRRKKRKIDLAKGECDEHKKGLLYFCFDCLLPLCYDCTKSYTHTHHKWSTLDTAYDKCKAEVGKQILHLNDKYKSLQQYHNGMEAAAVGITSNAEAKLKELKEETEKLRTELEKKEAEYERAITQMRDRKLATAESEKKWANNKLQEISKGLTLASGALSTSSPLHFFQHLIQHEEEVVELLNIPDKPSSDSTKLVAFPELPTHGLTDALSQLRYVERKGNRPFSLFGDNDDYSDSDED